MVDVTHHRHDRRTGQQVVVQILGGQGVTSETVVARIFADMRAFRIYDGPSEVHRWSLAKHILKGRKPASAS